METQELKSISQISQALWADSQKANRIAGETIAAVLTLRPDMTDADAYVSRLLLNRNRQDGVSVNAAVKTEAFFRLSPEERFTLAALYFGKWSYEKIAKVLQIPASSQVEELAWAARLELYVGKKGYPVGSGRSQASCPDYDSLKPWTQRFMDEQLSENDRFFLSRHMEGCPSCRMSLERTRNLFYSVRALLPNHALSMERMNTGSLMRARELDFVQKAIRVFRRPDVWGALIFLTLLWVGKRFI